MPDAGSSRRAVDVLDVSGRVVQTVCDGIFNAGIHEVPIDGTHLTRGGFFARPRTTGGTQVVKFVKLARCSFFRTRLVGAHPVIRKSRMRSLSSCGPVRR